MGSGGSARKGFCGESSQLRVAHVGPHFGEEPPITGCHGSGTVFFSGCSLRCSFCQNYQISREGMGEVLTPNRLYERVVKMIRIHHVHNINLVTPDHFFPHAFELVSLLRRGGYQLPVVFNLSGYQSIPLLKRAEDYADIYLPDFKYADPALSVKFSRCREYPGVALEAIAEMIRQKGFLDSMGHGSLCATKGVLVRHLILPGQVENSLKVLTMLFLEFGPALPLSVMSQYTPVVPQEDDHLNRPLMGHEFDRVYAHARDLGFQNLFVQFPERDAMDPVAVSPHLPDFRMKSPFSRKKTPY